MLERTRDQLIRYQNPDNDPRGPWRQGADGTAKSGGESLRYEIMLPSGRVVLPPSGNYWRFSKQTLEKARAENRVYFGKDGDRLPVIKKYLSEIQTGLVPKTWWPADEVGSNQEARRDHLRKLLPDIEPFATPKPERLLTAYSSHRHAIPAIGFSIPSPVPAPQALSRTRWGGGGSWWSWGSIATRISFPG